ncbi:hypothetical protein ACHAXM_007277 [Skeletonema potamos]|jgi:hypothetical protein
MDLLQGYGSSDSDDDDSVSFNVQPPTPKNQPEKAKPTRSNIRKPSTSLSTTTRGKRILSLGAVLPPAIFDRLTRPADADDSSTSSFEGGDDKRGGSKKRKRASKKKNEDNNKSAIKTSSNNSGDENRTELNSFLSELRSAPMEKKDGNDATSIINSQKNKSEKLGMAFMSYTAETKHNSNEVVDVHATKAPTPRLITKDDTKLERKTAAPSLSFSRISTAAPVANNVTMPQYPSAISYNNIPEYHVPQEEVHMNDPIHSNATTEDDYNVNTTMAKSRKQRREEERALRSGAAFQNPSATTEIHQPSPTEFAPTAHAAAIASRAARYRGLGSGGGGGGSVKNISMYDPKLGGDVSGQGITGKHRSKHQINSLMANAISLEAHRAAEAELARVGGGQKGGSSRADAKRKYGW